MYDVRCSISVAIGGIDRSPRASPGVTPLSPCLIHTSEIRWIPRDNYIRCRSRRVLRPMPRQCPPSKEQKKTTTCTPCRSRNSIGNRTSEIYHGTSNINYGTSNIENRNSSASIHACKHTCMRVTIHVDVGVHAHPVGLESRP